MTYVFRGTNSSNVYYDALKQLLVDGDRSASPRGKPIAELRPAVIEFLDPTDRVTYLKGRTINPFFQMAEALWIISGRSDVEWLANYNSNMSNFSDNGVHFNAPYGERLRFWGKNDYRWWTHNPLDQLTDVYLKLKDDIDTRQATAIISNPHFDNSTYTIDQKGKDIACNMAMTFKVRGGKLDITVFNRSNDLHWGTFGANLCQFSTIQEVIAAWLGIPVGTYYQITDSLHIYLSDYGSKETDNISRNYEVNGALPPVTNIKSYKHPDEPRMTMGYKEFEEFFQYYWNVMDGMIHSDDTYAQDDPFQYICRLIAECPSDSYWRSVLYSMVSYNSYKRGRMYKACAALSLMPPSGWRTSCMRFLSKRGKDNEIFTHILSGCTDTEEVAYILRENEH